MKNSMEVPQKTKKRVAIWFKNPTPRHISGQNYNVKRYTHTCLFIATLFTIAKTCKQPKCPSTEKSIKRCGAYTFTHTMEYCTAVKMEWRHLSNVLDHTKWSQSESERQVPYAITALTWYPFCMDSKPWPRWTYVCNRLPQNRLVAAKGVEKEGRESLGLANIS